MKNNKYFSIRNLSLIMINVILLLYIYFNRDKMDIFKEKTDAIISKKGLVAVKIWVPILFVILMYIFIKMVIYISNILKVKWILLFICILFVMVIWIDYKLRTNHLISFERKSLKDAIRDCNSYDLVLFRLYHTEDVPELLFYRWFHSLISELYSGHIGIIYKENGKVYVIETTDTFYLSHFDQKYKNGVMLNDFESYVKKYDGNVYICHNNIHKFKNNQELYECAYKYKDLNFFDNGIGCVNLVHNIFSELNIIMENKDIISPLPFSFTKKDIYKINYEDWGKYCIKKYDEDEKNIEKK